MVNYKAGAPIASGGFGCVFIGKKKGHDKKFVVKLTRLDTDQRAEREFYIQKKVESMSHQALKKYVTEIISHQINETIGKEEEMEAWRDMSEFFGVQFEAIIIEMQTKYSDDNNVLNPETDTHKQRLALLERNNLDPEKKDMWDD